MRKEKKKKKRKKKVKLSPCLTNEVKTYREVDV
jgi:hypothetical protein